MRATVLAALLLTAPLVGCLTDERPDEDLEPSGGSDEEDQGDPPREDRDDPSEDEQEGAREGNRSARGGEADEPTGSNASGEPEPFELEGSVAVGYLAAAGTTWIGGPEDVGVQDESHCPTAHLVVPAGSEQLTVIVEGEPAGSSGVGAYTIRIEGPGGDSAALDWASTPIDGRDALNWTTEDPAEGTWAIEARPEGPVVQQTWRIDAHVVGQALAPPDDLDVGTTC